MPESHRNYPPRYDHCGYGASPNADPVGCRGIRIPGRMECLAHLDEAARTAYFSELQPGDDIDLQGTTIEGQLLHRLLQALHDSEASGPKFGTTHFNGCIFSGYTRFGRVTFSSTVQFLDATFKGVSTFTKCTFKRLADFDHADFQEPTDFHFAEFHDEASFGGTIFRYSAEFTQANFYATHHFGPLICHDTIDLSDAIFHAPVTLELAADTLYCERTRWESTATFRLRHATVDLTNAAPTQPLSIASHQTEFSDPHAIHTTIGESDIGWSKTDVSIESLQGVDCTLLTLVDVDLSPCCFTGAFHLDQLRLEGHWSLNAPPSTRIWHRGIPLRWTRRQVIEEERRWRMLPHHPDTLRRSWGNAPERGPEAPGLAALTITYRQLRKAREDAKDEPGAADFYYGEMEMRRHSKRWGAAERWLLQAYWLLSGYGLRASRALCWLALAMMATMLLLMGFGLPDSSPKQEASGTVPSGGGKVTFEIDKGDPVNPTGDWFTTKRFEKALKVTLNSVVFRSSGQDLTTAGEYIEMASRFTEPVLLGLGALAIRGRVKR